MKNKTHFLFYRFCPGGAFTAFWPSFPLPTAAGRGGKKGKRPTVQYGKPTYHTCCFQTCDMPPEYIVFVCVLPAAERK